MKRLAPAAIIGALVLVFTAVNLSFNTRSGSLSRPPIYDDATYLLDAYQRLAFGGVDSLANLIRSFVSGPPHAPMTTLTGILGYSLLGSSMHAAYAANVWILALFAVTTYLAARRSVDQISSIAITALMLFAPASHALISEFRPDGLGGVILAWALFCILSTDYAAASRLHLAAVALVAVCAIMAKPSAVIATVPALGLAIFLGISRPFVFSRSEMISSARGATVFVGVFFALLVPCVLVWGATTYNYLYQVLITYRDMWAINEPPLYHWTFNSFGPGGQTALSTFLWLGLISIALDTCLSVPFRSKRENFNAVAFYFVVAVLYCGIAMFSQKSIWQGSFFYFPFLLATTHSLSRNLTRVGRRGQQFAAASLMVVAAIFMPIASSYQDLREYRDSGPVLASASAAIASEVSTRRSRGCSAGSFRLASMSPLPVAVHAVALALAMDHRIFVVPMPDPDRSRSADEAERAVDKADFIMLYKGKPLDWLPGSKFAPHVSATLATDPKWRPISSTGEYELFAKRDCV